MTTLSIIFSALSLILCCFFFLFFRAYIRRRTGREDIIADYRDEVNKLITTIDAATDRDARLVEERIGTLKKLLEETDKRMAVYVREFTRHKNSEALYTNLARASNKTVIDGNTPEKPVKKPIQKPIQKPVENSAEKPDVKEPLVQPPLFSEAAPRPFKEQVASLFAAGLSPAQIAARLAVSESEVDLALSLLNRNKK
jgi:hypothetical protein